MRRFVLCALLLGCPWLAPVQPLESQSLVVVTPAGKEPALSLGGLLQVQAEAGDQGDSRFSNDNDRFTLRRARLNASGKFLEEFDFRLEGEFAGGLSATSSLRGQLTDAYITWNRHPAATVRFGQFKTPFGFEQLYSDARLYTLERSLANDRLTLGRQVGVMVGGEALEKRLTYSVGAFNGNGANNNFNDDDRFLMVGRLAGTPWRSQVGSSSVSWSIGGNAYSSDDANVPQASEFGFDSTLATPERDNIFSGQRQGLGLDSQFQWGPLELSAEYLQTTWEPTSGRPSEELESEGWSAQGTLYVVPEKLQLVLKLESFTPGRIAGGDTTDTGTAGLSWYLKGHDLKLLLNYLRTSIDGQEDSDKVLARFQVVF